jgi:hypothetical protein
MKQKTIGDQDKYKLQRELVKSSLRLVMVYDAHVPDTLTRIRVLEKIAVVGQITQVFRRKKGKTMLDIYVKFLPSSGDTIVNLMSIINDIKKMPGIEIVKVLTVNGQVIKKKGKSIIV